MACQDIIWGNKLNGHDRVLGEKVKHSDDGD